MPKPSKLVTLAKQALEDLKGIDIKVLDVSRHTTVTDWWLICTGTSNRHVRSLAENVVEKVKETGERPRGLQGLERSEWVLVDLGSVVVHVLQVQARAHYQLEKLIPETAPDKPSNVSPAPRRSASASKGKPPKKKSAPRGAGAGAGKKKKPGKPGRK